MKILSILGSPRINGNTHFLTKKFADGAEGLGAIVEEVIINKVNVGPCVHCSQCHQDGLCRIEDDFPEVREKMKGVDGLLISTPVYCFSMPGPIKILFDRCHSMMFPDADTVLKGKKIGFIVGSGQPLPPDPVFLKKRNLHELNWKFCLSTGDPIRSAMDSTRPFDPTIDTLRLLYQFSVAMQLDIAGFMEVRALGDDKKAVQSRPEGLRKAVEFGKKFADALKV